MKFKHAFHVFVDNFSVTYKLLLYRIIVLIISGLIYGAVIYPFVRNLLISPEFTALTDSVKNLINSLLSGDINGITNINIREQYENFMVLLNSKTTSIVVGVLIILCVHLVSRFFNGIANYGAAGLVNDKMALQAKSKFILYIISNLKEAALYNIIYVPLSLAYDLVFMGVFGLLLFWVDFIPLFIRLFILAIALVASVVLKMTFTSDWLPSIIAGKKGQKKSLIYSFSRKGKGTANVFANYFVIVILILALNVCAAVFTFGVGLILSLPASYLALISFEFTNYYDREELKYFIDKRTIIKPDHERAPTREEFFKGE